MSILGCTGGAVLAGFGWYGAVHKEETYLTENQGVSVVIACLSYTILAVISLLGLIGAVIRHRRLISLYSTAVWLHLAFNITSGAYFIYTLFHKVGEYELDNCISSYVDDLTSQYYCAKEFEIYRRVIICLYITFCLLELGVCLVVASYVTQLREEEALDYPPPTQTAATVPPMATTYNYRNDYAFAQPDNSFGRDIV